MGRRPRAQELGRFSIRGKPPIEKKSRQIKKPERILIENLR
jgi:hypothetical protein